MQSWLYLLYMGMKGFTGNIARFRQNSLFFE
jgi:hypothetical protein